MAQLCRKAGLVEGERVYLDSTLIKANASLDSLVNKSLYLQLPEVKDYVDKLFAEDGIEKMKANELKISRTDADSSIIYHKHKGTFLAYKVHLAVDGGEWRIITAVSVTTGA